MLQHDGDDIGPLFTKVAATLAVLVLELEPVLLELEKAPVDIQHVRGPQVGLVDEFPLGVAQNFFEIDRRHGEEINAGERQFNGDS